MASSLPLLWVLATGCVPAAGPDFGQGGAAMPRWLAGHWYQDFYSDTFEVCGQPEEYDAWVPLYDPENTIPQTVWTVGEACQEALLEDLKYDWEVAEEVESTGPTMSMWSTAAAHGLLSWPMGSVEELRTNADGHYLRDPLIEALEALSVQTGEVRVQALLYNMVMSALLRTVQHEYSPTGPVAWVQVPSRTLHLAFYHDKAAGPLVLVHEMAHLWTEIDHVECPDLNLIGAESEGERWCDDDWSGAYGWAAGVAWLMELHYPWERELPGDPYVLADLKLAYDSADVFILDE